MNTNYRHCRSAACVAGAILYVLLAHCSAYAASSFKNDLPQSDPPSILAIKGSVPADGDMNVDPSLTPKTWFNQALDMSTLNADNVAVVGPEGAIEAKIELSDGGHVVSLVPKTDLFPQTAYTLFFKGLHTAHGGSLPFTAIAFKTAIASSEQHVQRLPLPASRKSGVHTVSSISTSYSEKAVNNLTDDLERWLPTTSNRNGNWRTGRPIPAALALRRNEALAPESLAPGGKPRLSRMAGTGVTGIILRQNDQPLARVKVSVGSISTRTDLKGEFVLSGIPAGRLELIVDGRDAGREPGTQYGYFVIGVNVQSGKETDVAPIYLPKILASDWVDVASPVAEDRKVTTSAIPGMEILIPKGAVLRDREGKLVTKIAMIPLPLDRMPFAFPENAPAFMSVQPNGLVVQGLAPGVSSGIVVRYPNQTGAAAGTRVHFWAYNTDDRDWQVYGDGQVTSDKLHVEPDAGVALYESIGFSYSLNNPMPPPDAPPPCGTGCCGGVGFGGGGPDDPPGNSGEGGGTHVETGGDPVDCKSGLFVLQRPDVSVRGILPVKVTRTYRPGDPTSRPFGYGQSYEYAMYLSDSSPSGTNLQQVDLVLSDGSYIRFHRISPGSDYLTMRLRHDSSASEFYGAILNYEDGMFVITKTDGFKLSFVLIGGKLISIRDRSGNTISVAWSGGWITRVTAAGGRYLDFEYDASNRITRITDIIGRSWIYAYSAAGYLTRVTYPDGLHEDYTYDTNGRMLTIADRSGATIVTNIYDANGRVSQQTTADGGIYSFAYSLDVNNKVVQTDITDPRGHVKRVTYGPNGYKASVTYAYGTSKALTTTYERDSTSGMLTAVVDSMARRTELQHDSNGNITQRISLAGSAYSTVENYTYTPSFNRLATYIDPLNRITTLTYDAKGNLLSINDPLSHSRTYTYNSAGQVVISKDALANSTTYAYEPAGVLRSVTDPLGRTESYYLDGLGRRFGTISAMGAKSIWNYDLMGRIVATTDAMSRTTTFTYDGNGNLAKVTNPNGGTTQYDYDARGRETSRTDSLGHQESWTYDDMGNVLSHEDREGQTTLYEYDELDRRNKTTYADSNTVEATYDAGGRLIQVYDSVSGFIDRTYDNADRLTQEQTPQGTVGYTYDDGGRRTQMTLAGQLSVSYGYDDANRMTSLTQGSDQVDFEYDAADRRTAVTLPNGVMTQTTYDNAGQTIALNYKSALGAPLGSVAYSYDEDGRRLNRTQNLLGATDVLPTATLGTNTFDLDNRLTQANGFGISYDDNGDPIVDDSTTPDATSYVFDARHRLVELRRAGSTIASFEYDAFGRRTSKSIGTGVTTFLYDGVNPVQETQGAAVSQILTGLGVDERYSRSESSGKRYYLVDALGSSIALVNAAGAVEQTYNYEPFGEVTAGGSSDNPYQYTGRENDGAGLYYLRARYYSPTHKRFVSEDPLGLQAGLNSYAYANGDPLSIIDPYGLDGSNTVLCGKDGTFVLRTAGSNSSNCGVDACLIKHEQCHADDFPNFPDVVDFCKKPENLGKPAEFDANLPAAREEKQQTEINAMQNEIDCLKPKETGTCEEPVKKRRKKLEDLQRACAADKTKCNFQ